MFFWSVTVSQLVEFQQFQSGDAGREREHDRTLALADVSARTRRSRGADSGSPGTKFNHPLPAPFLSFFRFWIFELIPPPNILGYEITGKV